MSKIVIITGLTCSGKSNLAIEIAKKYNGEIISADSVQIYRGLDIGSAKESHEMRKTIPHHLIDIKNFNETYNVSNFIDDCKNAISCVFNKNKTPIIVGGTGLYIKALIDGYSLGNCADLQKREYYQQLAVEKGNEFVWNILYELNPDKAKTVHKNNLKRVIRYIELENESIKPAKNQSILANYDYLAVGVVEDRDTIYSKINFRVDEMVKNGLFEEVSNLIKNGAKREFQSMNSIGYKELFDYFEGKTDRDTTINLIKQHTRNYCKRQLTFLKTIPNIELCNINQAKKLIEEFLND